MKDCADETCDDFALATLADEGSLIADFEEKEETAAFRLPTCGYCGHCPCGCGG